MKMKVVKNQGTQGDIFLQRIEKLPSGLRKKDEILARGEMTGHNHRVSGQAQVLVDEFGNQFVNVTGEAQVIHEEHAPVTLSKGVFRVFRQVEFDLVDEMRQVQD